MNIDSLKIALHIIEGSSGSAGCSQIICDGEGGIFDGTPCPFNSTIKFCDEERKALFVRLLTDKIEELEQGGNV
jgi:hypothetical protein